MRSKIFVETRVFEQSGFLYLQFVNKNATSHSILFNESSCNIDKYFLRSFIFFDPRDMIYDKYAYNSLVRLLI